MAVVTKSLLGQVTLAGAAGDTYVLTASALTANVQQADVRIFALTTTGIVDVTLPEITEFLGLWSGLRVMVVDSSGAAAASNITVRAGGADTIEGSATEVISTNDKCLIFRVAENGMWERSA